MEKKKMVRILLAFQDAINGYVEKIGPTEGWKSVAIVRGDIFSDIETELRKHFLTYRWYQQDKDRPWRVLLAAADKAVKKEATTGDEILDESIRRDDLLFAGLGLIEDELSKFKPSDFKFLEDVAGRLAIMLRKQYHPPDNLKALYLDFEALALVFSVTALNGIGLVDLLKPWVQAWLYVVAVSVVQKIWLKIFELNKVGATYERTAKIRNTRLSKRDQRKQELMDFIKKNPERWRNEWRDMKPYQRARKIKEVIGDIGGVDWIHDVLEEIAAEGALPSENMI